MKKKNITTPLPKKRKLKLSPNSPVNKEMVRELETMLECVPPSRLSNNIRDMFLVYLYNEHGFLPNNFKQHIDDLYFLFQFLDVLEEKVENDN